ncbi:unnamed protein product [Rhizoctonia solani]|uniref:Uncharacterized protein n=1 Tax=Rhizoctonia solani TaxID=456999 RepID=A0A8H3B5M2_9AGAM|nr:unnamed protein product [Rhizoctonia solani]
MLTRAIRPSANAARRIAIPTSRYTSDTSQRTNDLEVPGREKQKNPHGDQHSTRTHAPGWNEFPASDAEAHINAAEAIRVWEHTSAPYMKDVVEGPLGALARGARKPVNTFAKATATSHEEARGTLSDKGARAE